MPSGLVRATIAGAITRTDERELVSFVKKAIAEFGEIRLLIWLEPYTGPHHDRRFDPEALWHGDDAELIARIAIVGEPAWRTIRPAACRRRIPIEYFDDEQTARRWLGERRAHDRAHRPHDLHGVEPCLPGWFP